MLGKPGINGFQSVILINNQINNSYYFTYFQSVHVFSYSVLCQGKDTKSTHLFTIVLEAEDRAENETQVPALM